MKKDVFYLQYSCHDIILSELIEDGLSIILIPLGGDNIEMSFAKGRKIWEKLTEETPIVDCSNKEARRVLKAETFKDWGYKEPFIVYNDEKWPLY